MSSFLYEHAIRCVLFPIRLSYFMSNCFLLYMHATIYDYLNIKYSFMKLKNHYYSKELFEVLGLRMRITKNNAYRTFKSIDFEKEQYILLYNHISPFDGMLIYTMLEQTVPPVVSYRMKHLFYVGWIYRKLNSVYVGRHTSGRQNITDHLNSNKSLLIAPDGCDEIENESIPAFYDGGFICKKKKYMPIVIRYVPSIVRDINITSKVSLFKCFINTIYDGHTDVFIEFLDPYEDDSQVHDCTQIKNKIRNSMIKTLDALPKQSPSRYLNVDSSMSCAYSCLCGFGLLTCMAFYYNIYIYAIQGVLLTATGYIYHTFNTRNNLLLDYNSCKICMLFTCFYIEKMHHLQITMYLIYALQTIYYHYNSKSSFYSKTNVFIENMKHILFMHVPTFILMYFCLLDKIT